MFASFCLGRECLSVCECVCLSVSECVRESLFVREIESGRESVCECVCEWGIGWEGERVCVCE